MLSASGAMIGVQVVAAGIHVVARLGGWLAVLDIRVVGWAAAWAGIGLLFGTIPARKAAPAVPHETARRAYRAAPRYQPEARLSRGLFRIAVNPALKVSRAGGLRRALSLNQVFGAGRRSSEHAAAESLKSLDKETILARVRIMSKITSKLQVTLPKALADRLRIRPGDEIDWQEAGDALRVLPRRSRPTRFSSEMQLRLFDEATERQRRRQARKRLVKGARARGWTREELHGRGRAD